MKPSNDLFRLVKSLSRSEKGYFKKYTARHVVSGQNTYMALFNAIDRQEQYDEKKIREEFRSRAFIRRLPALKNYLYTLILRSLRAYYADASHSRRIRGLLDDYATLRYKQLYDLAQKTLDRARSLAERHDLNYYKPIVAAYEGVLHSEQFMSGTTTEHMEELFRRERDALEELLRINGLEAIKKRLFKHISEQGTRGADPDRVRDLVNDPLFVDAGALRSQAARLSFYQFQSTCAYYIGDYEQSRSSIMEALHLLNSDPKYTANYPLAEAALLHNLMGICILLGRQDEAGACIDRLRALPDTAYKNAEDRFTSVRCSELTLHLMSGDFAALRSLLPVLREEMHTFGDTLAAYYHRYLAYHIGWAYIALGEPSRALDHLNVVLNDRSADVREDLYCFARILNLLVHYELGNTELLHSEVRSTWRYLVQKQRTYRFETVLVQFIKKAIAAPSAQALRREFIALRQDLSALRNDPFESRAFTYFHFIPWLDSRIEGISFADAVRRYVQTEKQQAGT